jgi:type II secretory pathway pseudopilin PulG
MNVRAFTLIELVVVVAIATTLMGLVLGTQEGLTREAQVKAAAERFAGVCQQARSLAMAENAPYAIACNIQNAPGSSGRVINNRSGGPWYRMVGPREATLSAHGRTLLIAYCSNREIGSGRIHTFPDLVEALKTTWRGPQHQLPAGRVRFLALGDTDEGARINGGNQDSNATRAQGYGYAPTYPRPWFGWYDPARQRLFPWGGYDHQLGLDEPWTTYTGAKPVTNYTGFFYEGSDGEVVGCSHPRTRTWDNDWNRDQDFNDSDPERGPERDHVLYAQGAPRPLVSADWQDFLIVFRPDGRIHCPPFKSNRRRFLAAQSPTAPATFAGLHGNGVSDSAKPLVAYDGLPSATAWTAAYDYGFSTLKTEQAEIGHCVRNSGSYHISFAADAADDRDEFPSAAAALAGLAPIYRVQLGSEGLIRVRRVDIRSDAGLAGFTPYPATPDYWTDASTPGSARLAQEMRWGFFQQPLRRDGLPFADQDDPTVALPRGRPIEDVLTPRMLSGKIWWSDD